MTLLPETYLGFGLFVGSLAVAAVATWTQLVWLPWMIVGFATAGLIYLIVQEMGR